MKKMCRTPSQAYGAFSVIAVCKNSKYGNHPKAADLQVTKKSHEVIREIFYSSMTALP